MIDSGPAADSTISQANATFTFSGTPANDIAGFECKVDAQAFSACESPFATATLADGVHTFSVRALDPSGNRDASPAVRSFTVATGPSADCLQAKADQTKAQGLVAKFTKKFKANKAKFRANKAKFKKAKKAKQAAKAKRFAKKMKKFKKKVKNFKNKKKVAVQQRKAATEQVAQHC